VTRLPLNRRELLAGLAGIAILAACGDDDDTSAEGVAAGEEDGYSLLQFFAPAGALAADQPNRIPFGLGTLDGAFRSEVPDTLEVALVDQDGTELDRQTLPSLGDGLPRRYYSFEATRPGGNTPPAPHWGGPAAELPVQIHPAGEVLLVQPGDPMRGVDTPTMDDARGVDPICTRTPTCEFHQQTLTTALETGNPVAFMISTPTFCQTAVCGPVLDIMIQLSADYPDVEFVHAEVFENPGDGVTADTSLTEAVTTYGMEFEPSIIVADAGGTVVRRLDFIFAEEEMRQALDLVTG
jgi:hypothetical protein